MRNDLKWFVLTIDGENNQLSLSFVRQNSTKVYFLRNKHQYNHVSKAINTCLKYGWKLQEETRNKLYYSAYPIPELE